MIGLDESSHPCTLSQFDITRENAEILLTWVIVVFPLSEVKTDLIKASGLGEPEGMLRIESHFEIRNLQVQGWT